MPDLLLAWMISVGHSQECQRGVRFLAEQREGLAGGSPNLAFCLSACCDRRHSTPVCPAADSDHSIEPGAEQKLIFSTFSSGQSDRSGAFAPSGGPDDTHQSWVGERQ